MTLAEQLGGTEEFFVSGHRACAGCGATIALRTICRAVGKNSIIVTPTGCMEIISSMFPQTAWKLPWIHVAFENAGAVAAGIEAAIKAQIRKGLRSKDDKPHVVVIAGDGGTVDIGFQSLSGMLERFHDVLYICYDNEAYMNTGIQRSGSTPYGAWTTTTPVGKYSIGKKRPKKNMPAIVASHGVPYVATASISHLVDLFKKVRKGIEVEGPAYIQVYAPCVPGWRIDPSKSVEVAKLAVQTGYWPLYEIENGQLKITVPIRSRKPVVEFLKLQGRFRHLKEEDIKKIQEYVDNQCKQLGIP